MKKLFIISFEGMNDELLMEWIDDGHLPNFKWMRENGHLGVSHCNKVPYEAAGLITAFSGLSESEHGMLSYWKAHNKKYKPVVWSSKEVKDLLLWNQDPLKNEKFNIVNIFGTHPPYPINGNLLTYAMDRTLRYSYPTDLLLEFTSNGFSYLQDMGAFFKNQGKSQFLKEVSQVEDKRHHVCKDLIGRDMDVTIINYTYIDRVSHFYMGELRDDTIPLEEKAVFQAYKKCDAILNDILKDVNKLDANLLLFSAVGFGHLKKFIEINPYLEQKGFLTYSENRRRPDWKRTVAFESVQGTQGININRELAYEDGIVKESEYLSTRSELIDQLSKMKNPDNDNPMFSNVIAGSEFYDNNPNVPDIILEPFDLEYLPYGDPHWSDIVTRHSQTGWHRNTSVWGGVGPDISGKVKKTTPFGLINMAPTIVKLLKKEADFNFKHESGIV